MTRTRATRPTEGVEVAVGAIDGVSAHQPLGGLLDSCWHRWRSLRLVQGRLARSRFARLPSAATASRAAIRLWRTCRDSAKQVDARRVVTHTWQSLPASRAAAAVSLPPSSGRRRSGRAAPEYRARGSPQSGCGIGASSRWARSNPPEVAKPTRGWERTSMRALLVRSIHRGIDSHFRRRLARPILGEAREGTPAPASRNCIRRRQRRSECRTCHGRTPLSSNSSSPSYSGRRRSSNSLGPRPGSRSRMPTRHGPAAGRRRARPARRRGSAVRSSTLF